MTTALVRYNRDFVLCRIGRYIWFSWGVWDCERRTAVMYHILDYLKGRR